MIKPVSKYQSLKHYKWENDCDGWNLVDNNSYQWSRKKCRQGLQNKNITEKAQQFFFILKGVAQFEIEDATLQINSGEGLHIEAGKKHRILNAGNEDLEFILCSQPSTINDRINCK